MYNVLVCCKVLGRVGANDNEAKKNHPKILFFVLALMA